MHELIWECRDGRQIPVSQMTDSHLANAIALVRRRKGWRQDLLPRLELELTIRKIKREGTAT